MQTHAGVGVSARFAWRRGLASCCAPAARAHPLCPFLLPPSVCILSLPVGPPRSLRCTTVPVRSSSCCASAVSCRPTSPPPFSSTDFDTRRCSRPNLVRFNSICASLHASRLEYSDCSNVFQQDHNTGFVPVKSRRTPFPRCFSAHKPAAESPKRDYLNVQSIFFFQTVM